MQEFILYWDPYRLLIAPLTPFSDEGALVHEMIADQATILKSRGAQGFYILGSTGEGMLLTTAERVQAAESWRRAVDDQTPLIVHVGHGSIEEARYLAAHARDIGATAISSVGPIHYGAGGVDGLVNWSAGIAEVVPDTPFFHYFLGSTPNQHPCRASDYLAVAQRRIPNLAGIKFTHADLLDFGDCLRQVKAGQRVFYGKDEAMLAALSVGASAFVGGTYNLFAPLAVRLLNAFDAGDMKMAMRHQKILQSCISVLRRYGGLVALKAAMQAIGLELGPPRLPLASIDRASCIKLIAELEQVWPQMVGAAADTV